MEAMNAEATDLVDCDGDAWWMALARLRHSVALAQLGETSSARTHAAEAARRFERLADDFFLGSDRSCSLASRSFSSEN
jgi:hypothetical protein